MEELTLAAAPPTGLTVRPVATAEEIAACAELYRRVFRAVDYCVSPRLLSALNAHSGLVVGAWEGDRPVGFAYSFLAREPLEHGGRLYHYSQAAGVAEDRQNTGIGRVLKRAQGEAALAAGIGLMRWSYDPLRSRNAHFNLDVLGGSGRLFMPDYYGEEPSGLATDRLIVDWELDGGTVRSSAEWLDLPPAPTALGSALRTGDGRALLTIPDDWPDPGRFSLPEARALQGAVAAELTGLLADGYCAISCRRVAPGRAAYLLRRER